jgi:alkylation response protein AidB-like acyl-CoA dehydrogenase
MSYIASGQTHLIRMMYGGDSQLESFQEMLQTFGQLVEGKVLPAEKKTEMERAQDSLKNLAFQLSSSEKYDRQALETAIAQAKKNEKIPDEVYRQITDFGLPGMAFSEPLGGLEIPYPVFMACLETLGKASPSVGVRYAISNTVMEGLRFNYEAGQLSGYGESILRELIAGEKLAGFALTEGSAAGSNIMKEMITRAVPSKNGNGYRITGSKMFITNVETADVFAVFARTSEPSGDDPGISLFLVEKGTPGFKVGQVFEKRTVENSSLGELILDEVEVTQEHLVGEAGCAVDYGMRMLNSGRITIAALATGLAQRAFDEYLEVAVEGKKLGDQHLIELDRTRARVAEMSMEIHAARDMTYHAAWLKTQFDANPDNREFLRDYVIASNGAKLKASLAAQQACDHLVKIWGASAIIKENPAMKHSLDSWLYYFGEAVPEVLENTIAHMEVKKYEKKKGV